MTEVTPTPAAADHPDSTVPAPSAPRGRPRRAGTDHAILSAARELLLDGGYARLSMEAVASRSGVSKPTLYRRWPNKPALVADAVVTALSVRAAPLAVEAPLDSGDLAHDLHEWLDAFAAVGTDPDNAALVQALIAACTESPDDSRPLFELLTGPRHETIAARLRTAADAGEIDPRVDFDAVADGLLASVLVHQLTGRAEMARERAHTLLEVVLRGLRHHTG
ncbi:TetR/AcrR family transcriptional regulator [Streptomyces sp. NPDC056716]|uniref:TetR/AcrR family transcriptional regulator n=1 Tax=unclassified Streptomyces TaxID=2593676 RepID=UPI0036BCF81C